MTFRLTVRYYDGIDYPPPFTRSQRSIEKRFATNAIVAEQNISTTNESNRHASRRQHDAQAE